MNWGVRLITNICIQGERFDTKNIVACHGLDIATSEIGKVPHEEVAHAET